MNKHIYIYIYNDVIVSIRYSIQARVSQDYHLEPEQWRIGISSILASALNLAPSKDTFWTTERQPGNPLYPGTSGDQNVQRLDFKKKKKQSYFNKNDYSTYIQISSVKVDITRQVSVIVQGMISCQQTFSIYCSIYIVIYPFVMPSNLIKKNYMQQILTKIFGWK